MVEFISPKIDYRQVRSKFVREKIRGSSFSDHKRRAYIDDLMRIERYILTDASGWGFAGAMHYRQLKEKHPKEWSIIYRELKPTEFRRMLGRERQEATKRELEEEREKELTKKQEDQTKLDWLALGGQP